MEYQTSLHVCGLLKKGWCCDRLLGHFQAIQEKFETIWAMQKHDIHVVVRVIEHVDVLIHNHITFFSWHLVEVVRECMDAVNTNTLFVDKNPLRVA
jgi:hypothetical protein